MQFKAMLFGSIGTLAETSDIQRNSFNEAFKISGLDWFWDEDKYRNLLSKSGGTGRINDYAKQTKNEIDGRKIRNLKTKIFNEYLSKNKIQPREGVKEIIKFFKKNKIKIGLASSTTTNNINSIFNSLRGSIEKKDFDFIGNNEFILREKPYPDIYNYALKYLNIDANECLAIEDTEESLNSALSADIKCIAFPGKYHTQYKFDGNYLLVNKLSAKLFDQ